MVITACHHVLVVVAEVVVETVVAIVQEHVADVVVWAVLVVVLVVRYLYLINHGWNKRAKRRVAIWNGKEHHFHSYEGLPACL